MTTESTLLKNHQLTPSLILKNKIVMAPMTRAAADDDGCPTHQMASYYARRADAGLIITEGVVIGADATGYKNTPGIYTENQVEKWKPITEAVHKKDGKIFMQIWHVGRVSHPAYLEGRLPISASATTMEGRVRRTQDFYYGESREATLTEIKSLVKSYAKAAKNAIRAGFDGIEIHGTNGYLVDQFLHHQTNLRQDEYGGTAEKMSRFALEVVEACSEAIGYDRVGIRLSPGAYLNEVKADARDHDVFSYLLSMLNQLPIAYVHTGNFDDKTQFKGLKGKTMTQFIREHYHGTVIASGGYDLPKAEEHILHGDFDIVAIGRPFIANPNLIQKYKNQQPLIAYDVSMLESLN